MPVYYRNPCLTLSSGLIDICAAGVHSAGLHSQAGENPELRTLFFKFCRFLKAPVTLVCVFDGPARPLIKRGKKVVNRQLWIIDHVKSMIKAFGFYCHDVSGFLK
jgi:Holliday junction resolvase YEN1